MDRRDLATVCVVAMPVVVMALTRSAPGRGSRLYGTSGRAARSVLSQVCKCRYCRQALGTYSWTPGTAVGTLASRFPLELLSAPTDASGELRSDGQCRPQWSVERLTDPFVSSTMTILSSYSLPCPSRSRGGPWSSGTSVQTVNWVAAARVPCNKSFSGMLGGLVHWRHRGLVLRALCRHLREAMLDEANFDASSRRSCSARRASPAAAWASRIAATTRSSCRMSMASTGLPRPLLAARSRIIAAFAVDPNRTGFDRDW